MGDFYKKGDWNAICAICGFEYKASEMKWNSQINDYVCKEDWETRHPQERIRAVKDNQRVEWTRPDPVTNGDQGDKNVTLTTSNDVSIFFGTDLTANRTITLTTTGYENGDTHQINRTGHGDYSLDVGGLVSLTNPVSFAFAKIQFNGSSWVLKDSDIL